MSCVMKILLLAILAFVLLLRSISAWSPLVGQTHIPKRPLFDATILRSERHDYSRDPSDGANVDLAEVNALIAQRLAARKVRKFRLADSIRDHLRSDHGVEINDKDLLWSASPGANFEDKRGGAGPRQRRSSKQKFGPNGHDYTRTGGPTDPSCQLLEQEIHSLIAERLRCKLDRNYRKADNIQHMMWDKGVRIHDGRRQWRDDGVSFADDEDGDGGGRGQRLTAGSKTKGSSNACQKSPHSQPISPKDEQYVSKLVEKRMRAKRDRNYEIADDIRSELLASLNVHIDDRLRQWSVGGDFGDNEGDFGPAGGDEYFFVGKEDNVAAKDLDSIKKALTLRSAAKRKQRYDIADTLRDELYNTFGIRINDKRKSWYFKGNVEDSVNEEQDHKQIPWGDEIEDEYGDEGGEIAEESSSDDPLIAVADSYSKAGGSANNLSEEDEKYITERLERRAEAWQEKDFDTAEAIKKELLLTFNVHIYDDLGQWSVGEIDTTCPDEEGNFVDRETESGGDDTYTREALEELTIPLLKDQLRERGLKVGGKKSELIDRLLS